MNVKIDQNFFHRAFEFSQDNGLDMKSATDFLKTLLPQSVSFNTKEDQGYLKRFVEKKKPSQTQKIECHSSRSLSKLYLEKLHEIETGQF